MGCRGPIFASRGDSQITGAQRFGLEVTEGKRGLIYFLFKRIIPLWDSSGGGEGKRLGLWGVRTRFSTEENREIVIFKLPGRIK